MWSKALNAKPLPFLSGTLKPLDFYIDDLEEKLKEPLTELNRLRVKGEWNMYIGSIEQGIRNMESDARKWLH